VPCGTPSEPPLYGWVLESTSKPHASNNASGTYFEFLFARAHSRRRAERTYWSGVSLNSSTARSNRCWRDDDRAGSLRFSPIRIATALCHCSIVVYRWFTVHGTQIARFRDGGLLRKGQICVGRLYVYRLHPKFQLSSDLVDVSYC
jgi:hypothetical protein